MIVGFSTHSLLFLATICCCCYWCSVFVCSSASFPSGFGPQNCTDPNEEFHQCIGICPGSKHWRDLTCADLEEEEKKQQQKPSNQSPDHRSPANPCFSLRCFPGCRCKKGFVREVLAQGQGNGKCMQKELCNNKSKS